MTPDPLSPPSLTLSCMRSGARIGALCRRRDRCAMSTSWQCIGWRKLSWRHCLMLNVCNCSDILTWSRLQFHWPFSYLFATVYIADVGTRVNSQRDVQACCIFESCAWVVNLLHVFDNVWLLDVIPRADKGCPGHSAAGRVNT